MRGRFDLNREMLFAQAVTEAGDAVAVDLQNFLALGVAVECGLAKNRGERGF